MLGKKSEALEDDDYTLLRKEKTKFTKKNLPR